MTKKNGFTLIELLAVLIVLGLITVIAYPAVEQSLKSAKEDLYDTQVASIVSGAKNWVADHPYDIPKNNGDELTVSLCELKFGSYVDSKISNPKTNKMFDCGTKIKIKNVNNTYEYDIDFDDTIEEDVPDKIIYPKVSLVGSNLNYIDIGDVYDYSSILIDNEIVMSDTDLYTVNITTDMVNNGGTNTIAGVSGRAGTFTVRYEIITKATNVKTVLYKTVIVIDRNVSNASHIIYDNTKTGMYSTNLKDAIDELYDLLSV